ncbi:TonB-dependent receptor [Telluribacter sp.]|uniref:TonB-dependent receptor n=1 Tax=Telluribacter sp. TaxID=1978767 RepID=UPI002E1327D0|nr:TonB-dependent receptor [Telluribacter sp.]
MRNHHGGYRCVFCISILFLVLGSASSAFAVKPETGSYYRKASSLEETITGRVTDTKGDALAGVSVLIKGTNRGTTSEADGTFRLSANRGDVLVFSFVGFESQQVPITGSQPINVRLTEGSSTLNEMIVTGTRSGGRTRIDTPVPVDVIPLAEVTNSVGQVDINQILTFLAPSFQSARQTVADGTDHIDPAQLRGLGPDQVLVLVNGKRRHQSALVNVNGTVNRGTVGTDMNAILATAVEKIEILRDGAAAQYGSDAIAGVINIVLKRQTGLSANASYGMHATSYQKNYAFNVINNVSGSPTVSVTDGQTAQIGVNYGIAIGERGFINLTGEYTSRQPTNRTGLYTGQIFPSVNGQVVDNELLTQRGLTREDFDMRIGNSRIVGGGVMLNAEIPVSTNFTFYAFGGYNNKQGEAAGFFRYPNAVPAAARANVFAVYPNGFLPLITSNVTDASLSAGVRGRLGEWTMDLSNTFGQNVFDFGVDNSVNYTQALSQPNFQRTFDAGGLKFLQNTINLDFSRKYDVLAGLNLATGAEFRIDQFGIRAGEESSWRNYNTSSGVAAGAQVFSGFLPSNEGTFSRNNKALYLDVEQDITDKLLVSAALRYENYSDFGSTLNYKVSTRFKVTDFLALRASTSTGFRAPSMQQRFYAKSNTLFVSQGGQLVAVESGTFTNESQVAGILGIPRLKQETSQNFSVGTTMQLARSLELTLDAYQIDINDRIVLTNNFTANNNADLRARLEAANANTANVFTNAIDTRSRGLEGVLNYSTRFANNQSLKFILAATLIKNEVKKDANGNPIIKASPVLEATGQRGNYFNREDQSRIEVANPQNKISFMATYKIGKLNLMARAVHFGKVVYLDPSINPANPNSFPVNAFTGNRETLDQTFSPKTVTDVSATYQLLEGIGLTLGANNVFDVYQDIHTHSNNMSLGRFVYSRRVQQMGFGGRYVFARVVANF